MSQVTTGFVLRDSTQIAYEMCVPTGFGSSVPPSHKVLLLINGYQRTRTDFRALQKRLAVACPWLVTVSFDNRGVGDTQAPQQEFSMGDMAADAHVVAQDTCSRFGVSSYSVLGISMGGMIAQALAGEIAPAGVVESLVLVSTTLGGAGRVFSDEALAPGAHAFQPWSQSVQDTERRLARYFAPRFLRASPLIFKAMVQGMVKAVVASAGQNAMELYQFKVSSSFDATAYAHGFKGPVLVISGADDAIIPLENARVLARTYGRARLSIYSEVGHLILVEEPGKLVDDLVAFFKPQE